MKRNVLVRLDWSNDCYTIRATNEPVAPKIVCPIISAQFSCEPIERIIEVAHSHSGKKPNAYFLTQVASDVLKWEYAPIENIYAFQLFRIPPRFLKDVRLNEFGHLTIHYG